jgi:hypothetical protein
MRVHEPHRAGRPTAHHHRERPHNVAGDRSIVLARRRSALQPIIPV